MNVIKYTYTHLVFIKVLYQKINKCFTNFIPIHIIPNILKEKEFDLVFEERLIIKTLKNQILK